MNMVRTAMLLAFMTALFMAIGYAIGGTGGMLVALVIAGLMNIFSYWNADKMVLRMHNAVEIDERSGDSVPESWQVYFRTDDVSRTVNTVVETGGKLLVPITELADVTFAVVTDDEGHLFAVERLND